MRSTRKEASGSEAEFGERCVILKCKGFFIDEKVFPAIQFLVSSKRWLEFVKTMRAGPAIRTCAVEEALASTIDITQVRIIDLRFPTSLEQIGSDAVNKDPDYSAAYCILETDAGLEGHGLTFTLGRGTDLVVRALRVFVGFCSRIAHLSRSHEDFNAFYLQLTGTHNSAGLDRKRASSTWHVPLS